MEKLEKIIIDKEQIDHMVKALFDNGKRSLFYINGKIMTQIYLEFITDTDMIEIFQDVYDLEKLKEEALKRGYYVIEYEKIFRFTWMSTQTAYYFSDEYDYTDALEALEAINECLANEHDFKTGSDIVLYTQ